MREDVLRETCTASAARRTRMSVRTYSRSVTPPLATKPTRARSPPLGGRHRGARHHGGVHQPLYQLYPLCRACPDGIDTPYINAVVRDWVNRGTGSEFDWLVEGLTPDEELRGLSLQKHLFGNFETVAKLDSVTAPLSNWLAETATSRWLLDRFLGVDPRRDLPESSRRRSSAGPKRVTPPHHRRETRRPFVRLFSIRASTPTPSRPSAGRLQCKYSRRCASMSSSWRSPPAGGRRSHRGSRHHLRARPAGLEAHTVTVLEELSCDVITSDAECCGMVDSFSYKSDYSEVSIDVREYLGNQFTADDTVY